MKKIKILRILATVAVLSLLLAFVATPAYAVDKVIELTPSTGTVGDSINIYGYGFSAVTVYIYFSSDRAYVDDFIDDEVTAYERVGITTPVSEDTYAELDTYFTVPSDLSDGTEDERVTGGTYYVYVTYYNYDKILAFEEFTVEAVGEIELDLDKGPVDTEVEITGQGFDDEEDIIVEYDGDEIDIASGDEETDDDGEFTCTIIIPESTGGEHTISVIGEDSDIEAEAEFTVEAEIAISPDSGAVGDTITVSGTGFGYRSETIIYIDNTEVAEDETDRAGSFEVTFNVPNLASGTYDVEVEDEEDNSDKVKFTIAAIPAAATFSPKSGYIGTKVTVSGTNFETSKPITVTFADVSVGTTTSDGNGSFATSFNVPASPKGTYKMKVTDGVNTKESDFTVLLSANISQVTSVASPGHIGTKLTISGTGFVGKVSIKYDDSEVTTATAENGAFSATFTVPKSEPGEHKITASDGTNTEQFTFTMESRAPPTPSPLKPEMGVKAEAETYFDWEDVEDDSPPVTYNLQIATDEDFKDIVLEKEGLTESEYTITEEEALEPVSKKAPYYWRVQAIDGASNESKWTGAGSFYLGMTFTMPKWVTYTLLGIGVLLIFIFGIWIGRRTSYYSY